MSNTLSISRLLKLIVYEQKSSNYLPNITICMIIGYTFYICLLEALSDYQRETLYLSSIFQTITTIISPLIFYYPLLNKNKRILYAILPASNTEKYLSILINNFIIAPFIITLFTYAANYVEWLIFFRNQTSSFSILNHLPSLWDILCISAIIYFYFSRLTTNSKIVTGTILIILPILNYLIVITDIKDETSVYIVFTVYLITLHLFIFKALKNISDNIKR